MFVLAILLLSAQASTVGSGAPPKVVVGLSQMPPAMVQELQRAVRSPQGRLPAQRLFSPDDYPAGADGRRGTVAARLIIAPQGSIIGCSIMQSSGSALLDSTTCNTIRRRQRYTPALDKDGKAVLGIVDELVDWDKVFSKAGKSENLSYALRFGATPTSPIGPPIPCAVPTPGHTLCPYHEPDYVPNYERVLPQAIQSCGASFVRFEPLTEGAERAFFDVDSVRATEVIACIKQHVPQGNIDTAAEGAHL